MHVKDAFEGAEILERLMTSSRDARCDLNSFAEFCAAPTPAVALVALAGATAGEGEAVLTKYRHAMVVTQLPSAIVERRMAAIRSGLTILE